MTQICQNIKLFGSRITKDLKKPHLSRQVGGAEMWRRSKRCGEAWRCMQSSRGAEWAVPQSGVLNKNCEGYLGSEGSQTRPPSPGSHRQEEKSPKLLSIKTSGALAGVAQWIECQPVNRKVTASIPSQGTCLGCRPGPQLGECKRQWIGVSLPFFLSLPLSLKVNK